MWYVKRGVVGKEAKLIERGREKMEPWGGLALRIPKKRAAKTPIATIVE